MSISFQVNLTDTEEKAISFAAVNPQEWFANAVLVRCNGAIEDIVKICFERCMEESVRVPATKAEMVDLAFANGWVKTAAQVQEEIELARTQAQQQQGA